MPMDESGGTAVGRPLGPPVPVIVTGGQSLASDWTKHDEPDMYV